MQAKEQAKPTGEILGIDHIYVAVSDLARSKVFYDTVFALLGFRQNSFILNGDAHVQYYNRHFGYVIRPAHQQVKHDPYAPGLHHLCLRVGTAADVALIAERLNKAGIEATAPCLFEAYAPDYVATYFNDPDGLRLEITNYRQERQLRHDCWDSLSSDTDSLQPPLSEKKSS